MVKSNYLSIVVAVFVAIAKCSLAILCFSLALYLRTPLFAGTRNILFWILLLLGVGLFGLELVRLKHQHRSSRIGGLLILSIAFGAIAILTTSELKFNFAKQRILNSNSAQLAALGQHFVVGYRNIDEVKKLAETGAIGGIFITRRNIKNKTVLEIKQEIAALQSARVQHHLPPLWVATDQEGGIVSRLSPPLTQLPPLAQIVDSANSDSANSMDQQTADVIQYARVHGEELANLGVNLNFAPVVDLNKNVVNPRDKFSQIYRRAISTHQQVVADVALQYCQTLEDYGVRCTIKHFPGLGGVATDTHIEEAELWSSIAELTQADWVPFRKVMSQSNAVVMLGHAKLMAVDDRHPVSFSQPVVTGILRDSWQHQGVLITDDFSMQAVYGSELGLENAAIASLNAGVDLILISYDTDLYYEAMMALLKAETNGLLNVKQLETSQRRLAASMSNRPTLPHPETEKSS
ncbi:glycoside hydrolase family 3 protein [Oculatella sp. LEGE 06141]|uniref:glycoside hydrolase family 3 protein n=1 Tax=Oculatella sp. LEGE 06141 TaxID=1828648 RepID=UPI001881A005|nr:glycoside hydrolase family 3 protein [Oculatella sp. LEGE 06141]MBE9178213.1 glycoside hydrolase family 3 protein [Oculatella sp. LEGE 06141]